MTGCRAYWIPMDTFDYLLGMISWSLSLNHHHSEGALIADDRGVFIAAVCQHIFMVISSGICFTNTVQLAWLALIFSSYPVWFFNHLIKKITLQSPVFHFGEVLILENLQDILIDLKKAFQMNHHNCFIRKIILPQFTHYRFHWTNKN